MSGAGVGWEEKESNLCDTAGFLLCCGYESLFQQECLHCSKKLSRLLFDFGIIPQVL